MSDADNFWTDEDTAWLTYESLPDWHPAVLVDVFRTGLEQPQVTGNEILARAFVTPESLEEWGDFSRARSVFGSGLKISMKMLYGKGARDVAYVRLVETDAHFELKPDRIPATMHVTLVWRPEIAVVPGNCWRIHHLGAAIEPSQVPRTVPGFDPTLQR